MALLLSSCVRQGFLGDPRGDGGPELRADLPLSVGDVRSDAPLVDGLIDAPLGDVLGDFPADAAQDGASDRTADAADLAVDSTRDSAPDQQALDSASPDGTGSVFPSVLTLLPDFPLARTQHAGVWTGRELIVWGGRQDFYDFCSMGSAAAPQLSDGARFFLEAGQWRVQALPNAGAPGRRMDPPAVYTGSEFLVWGGCRFWDTGLSDGAAYSPDLDAWRPVSTVGAPAGSADHSAVWTGEHFVIWGGHEGNSDDAFQTGAAYDPVANTWQLLPVLDAPQARHHHTAVWTGEQMIVWGGQQVWNEDTALATGGVYTPGTTIANGSWKATSSVDAPSRRTSHTATWTGTEMIVWGGRLQNSQRGDGAAYDPLHDTWRPLPSANAPPASYGHAALWTGEELLIVGGCCAPETRYHIYDPTPDSWRESTISSALFQRYGMAAAYTGAGFIFYGGAQPPGNTTLLSSGAYVPHP